MSVFKSRLFTSPHCDSPPVIRPAHVPQRERVKERVDPRSSLSMCTLYCLLHWFSTGIADSDFTLDIIILVLVEL